MMVEYQQRFQSFNNKLTMSSNGMQDSHHLLEWINKERISLKQSIPWYSLSQLEQGNFIQSMLGRLDSKFFNDIEAVRLDYASILKRIEEYLDKFLGNKIKRRLRNQMVEECSWKEIVKIIFYLCVQSDLKSEYIHRVFELPQNTQGLLMNDLKDIEQNIESIMEVKDILKKLEQLQQQNDILREQLRQNCCTTETLSESLKETEEERVKLTSECKIYKKQKDTVLQELGVTELKEYAALYRELKSQNEELNEAIKIMENRIKMIEGQKKELKEKVHEDNQLIYHLNDQMTKLKALYQNAWLEISYYQENAQNDIALKQNKTFGNMSTRNSQNFKNSQRESLASDSGLRQDIDGEQLRVYNQELMKKLQQSYRRANTLNQENNTLQNQLKEYRKGQDRLNKKLNELRTHHQSFVSSYGLTITE